MFDELDDDMYDGQLGEDDYQVPRILIEYSVVGGKYTSVMNNMERLKEDLSRKQEEAGGSEEQAQNTDY